MKKRSNAVDSGNLPAEKGFVDGSIGGLGVSLLYTIPVATWFTILLLMAVQKMIIKERF